MKAIKQTLISISTAMITIAILYGGYTIYAADQNLDFRQPKMGFDFVEDAYHKTMNEYFNKKMAHLVDILEEDNFGANPDFSAPEKS